LSRNGLVGGARRITRDDDVECAQIDVHWRKPRSSLLTHTQRDLKDGGSQRVTAQRRQEAREQRCHPCGASPDEAQSMCVGADDQAGSCSG